MHYSFSKFKIDRDQKLIAEEDEHKARDMLAEMLHEIRGKIRTVEAKKIGELFRRKKSYRDVEAELGIP